MITITKREEIIAKASDLLSDESRFTLGIPSAVYFPETEFELQLLVKELNNNNIPITFSGAKTGITGGAVPTDNSVIISFNKLNKIKDVIIDKENVYLKCEPGITLSEINLFLQNPSHWNYPVNNSNKLEANKWFYAPDPTELSAQLGGTIATNASGARSFRYGSTRDSITALDIILASGEKVTLSRNSEQVVDNDIIIKTITQNCYIIPKPSYTTPHIKNAAGYFSSDNMEPIDLFIGSEGTLGAVCCTTIKLQKRLNYLAGLSFFPNYNSAFSFSDFLRKRNDINAIEYFDETTLPFIEEHKDLLVHKLPIFPPDSKCAVYWEYASETAFIEKADLWESKLKGCNSSLDLTWSGYTEKEKRLLKQFRHSVPEIVNTLIGNIKKDFPNIRKISSDTAVSKEHFSDLYNYYTNILNKEKLTYVVFGHLGDFHLHFNIIPKDNKEMKKALIIYKKMMKKAIEFEGTVSAEHGIGKLKKKYLKLMYGQSGIKDMRKIKEILDPQNLLNPETLF